MKHNLMKRIVVLAVLLILTTCVIAAPAPVPKQSKIRNTRDSFVGHWQGTWGGSKATAYFGADGYYEGTYFDMPLYGTWRYEDNHIYISETRIKFDPEPNAYTHFDLTLTDETRLGIFMKANVTWEITNCKKHGRVTVEFHRR